jgi:hypothetical protein
LLDGDLDARLGLDMGAYELDHVVLDARASRAGSSWKLRLDFAGTTGMPVVLIAGNPGTALRLPPFGDLFVRVDAALMLLPLGALPLTADFTVPSLDAQLQALAFTTRSGNFSNSVRVTLR